MADLSRNLQGKRMYYKEELVEEIRSRNDIVDVISGYVTLKKKGRSHWGCCPFHNEKTPSFSVSQSKQMYYSCRPLRLYAVTECPI